MTKGSQQPRPAVAKELPSTIYLETTNRCDSKCQTCIRTFATLEPPADLTLERLVRIVQQHPTLTRTILHGIGEPLLNKELFPMIDYLKGRGVTVTFNSDAISLTDSKIEQLLHSAPDEFRVSIDAATPETYLKIRGVSQFHRVVDNISRLIARQRELDRPLPKVSLWFTGIRANIHELPDLIRLAHKLGVAEVYLQRLVFYETGLAVREQSLYGKLEATVREAVEEAERLCTKYEIAFHASGASAPLQSLAPDAGSRPWAGCQRPWTVSYVTANGNVLPCCIAPWTAKDYRGAILGNAFQQPLAEIWNGERYQTFRMTFESDTPPDPCRGCGNLWSI
ncbi:MAG: SPASM domain-containing protein [candidate division NC10 bacterium]|nr:SPASM domain-containing protein [candidate division NC10 bacterium]